MNYPYKPEEILRTRTSKILGGYLSEYFFEKRFCQNRNYTKKWWCSLNPIDNRLIFFVVGNTLLRIDEHILNKFCSHGVKCYILQKSNNQWYVKDINHSITIEEFINKNGLKEINPNRKYMINSYNNDSELKRCIQVYTNLGLIDSIAESLVLEDWFLNKYFYTTNIDFIVNNENNNLECYEIKFKNEFSKNNKLVFGIDKFQYEYMFKPLLKCGIHVRNCVIYNDKKRQKNKSMTDIFNYVEGTKEDEFIWKYKNITQVIENYDLHTIKGGYTSWTGKKSREVYCIPLNEYRDFCENPFQKDTWGRCDNNGCIGYKRIRTNSRTGQEFMGCTNYKAH